MRNCSLQTAKGAPTGVLIGLILLLIGCPGINGNWPRTIWSLGDTEVNAVKVTPDGGFLVVGCNTSLLDESFGGFFTSGYLLKISGHGNVVWDYNYRGGLSAEFVDADAHPEGGYLVVGNQVDFIQSPLIVRIGEAGDVYWRREYPGLDNVRLMAMDNAPDSSYLVAGTAWDDGKGRAFVMKIDSQGDEVWSIQAPSSPHHLGYTSVRATEDGGCIVATRSDFGVLSLLKLDTGGSLQWSRCYEVGDSHFGFDTLVDIAPDGGYTLVGRQTLLVNGGNFRDTVHVVRTDVGGEVEWSRVLEYPGYASVKALRTTPEGGYVLCGAVQSEHQETYVQAYVLKLDAQGKSEWERCIGALELCESANDIECIPGVGYIVAGTVHIHWGTAKSLRDDVFLFRLDEQGRLVE